MNSIFRIVALVSLLFSCLYLHATATVSGTIKDPGGAVVPNSFVRFELANTNNNQCSAAGVTLGKRLVDFTANTTTGAISGTLYRTDTEISCGGFFTSRYNMTIYRKGVPDGPSKCVIVSSDFNIASPIYCTAQTGAPALPAPQFVQTNPAGSQTIVQPGGTTFAVNGDVSVAGATTLTTLEYVAQMAGTIRNVAKEAGADWGAQVAACIANLPSTGGTCDARSLNGAQSMSSNLNVTKANVMILVGNTTVNQGGFLVNIPAGTHSVAFIGQPGYGGPNAACATGGSIFNNTSNFSAIQVGSSAADTFGFVAQDIGVTTTGGGSAAQGFQLNRVVTGTLLRPRVCALATASTQAGIVLDGTGNYTAVKVDQPYISNGNVGILLTGTAPDCANASQVIGGVATGATAGSSIGIDIRCGDGNTIVGTDIEGYSIGLRLNTTATNNFVAFRPEANTSAVTAIAGATNNVVFASDSAAPVTDGGTSNTIHAGGILKTKLQSTVATGTAPLSVASITVTPNLNADMVDGVHVGNVSAGKAMCWKDATHLGYCSTVVDAGGACTCN